VARTQELAARLHRRVVGELLAAGARPFSFVPSSALVLAGGRPAGAAAEPLVRALGLGLLPVTHGDVMLDREVGYGICSTELLFERLVGELAGAGIAVAGCLWLGETPGIWDAAGRPLPRIDPGAAGTALAAAGESAGTDVTGGMRLRLESALRLAARGVESWILDGREERVVARGIAALAGGKPPVGTRVG
jgi:isopentenyl phosphate kinase